MLREVADELRVALSTAAIQATAGAPVPRTTGEAAEHIALGAAARLGRDFAPSLRRVINATGVVVHTNLGRAPLSTAALKRLAEVARGYSNLEFDLARGERGRRDLHAEALITRLTGAAAAVVVNNNAAATLLMLTALAQGREVIISRGELVEIGGGFRVPEIMAQSGAVLREVGTTNRTRVADYAAAINDRTALILRVHPSNFRIEGFTERPEATALSALAHAHSVALAEDLGSGHLGDGPGDGDTLPGPLREEPSVRASLQAGVDILCFSGDKLLGGPQAGVLVGRRDLVDTVRQHPLMRALRVDKLTYAALETTLISWLSGRADEVPVARMVRMSRDRIAERVERMLGRLAGVTGARFASTPGDSTIGGGSAPGSRLPTCLLVVEKPGESAASIERALRALDPAVIARIDQDRVVLDLRTVGDDEDEELASLLGRI